MGIPAAGKCTLTIYLPIEAVQVLREDAARRFMSISDMVLEALSQRHVIIRGAPVGGAPEPKKSDAGGGGRTTGEP